MLRMLRDLRLRLDLDALRCVGARGRKCRVEGGRGRGFGRTLVFAMPLGCGWANATEGGVSGRCVGDCDAWRRKRGNAVEEARRRRRGRRRAADARGEEEEEERYGTPRTR
eukprot:3806835-Rhodomonas_salina.1